MSATTTWRWRPKASVRSTRGSTSGTSACARCCSILQPIHSPSSRRASILARSRRSRSADRRRRSHPCSSRPTARLDTEASLAVEGLGPDSAAVATATPILVDVLALGSGPGAEALRGVAGFDAIAPTFPSRRPSFSRGESGVERRRKGSNGRSGGPDLTLRPAAARALTRGGSGEPTADVDHVPAARATGGRRGSNGLGSREHDAFKAGLESAFHASALDVTPSPARASGKRASPSCAARPASFRSQRMKPAASVDRSPSGRMAAT